MEIPAKKIRIFFIPLLFLVLILSGCVKEYGMEDTENTVDENLIVVGVSQVGSESVCQYGFHSKCPYQRKWILYDLQ